LAESIQLLSRRQEAQVMWRLRRNIVRTLGVLALRNSRLQVVCVLVASLILWVGLFGLFFEGFQFIRSGLIHAGLRMQLVHIMFNVFFLTLTVMLLFSTAIILYGMLYRGEEVKYLLTIPVREERIVLHKFQESVFFSGWGFLLLGSPMLLAYGAVFRAPWHYYALLLPFMLTFVHVPAALGGIACLVVVRILRPVRVHALAVCIVAVLLAGGYFAWNALAYQNRDMMSFSWFQDVLARLQFSEQRLLPSWWLSSGLLEATHAENVPEGTPPWLESLMFLSVLTSNALLLQLILRLMAARFFRDSYSSLQGIVPPQRQHRVWWLDRLIERLCRPLPVGIRHMIIKDLRLFRRDPVQWSQFVIFFGLLVLYFLNVRRFDYSGVMEQWVTVMSFLNVAVVGLLLSTFTTRFVFPTISLEGRRFWVLGTAPITRDTIIWGKFWFACVGAWPVCALLVLISDLALGIWQRSTAIVVVHQLQCLLLCSGLAALAVGLGARLPNMRDTSPARIASGFGGTLNLVISSLYIVGVLLVTSVPTFIWAESSPRVLRSGFLVFWGWFKVDPLAGMAIGVILGVALGAIATLWPMRAGLRAFRKLEH
jgi:ABC-2 type transport system permease protein